MKQREELSKEWMELVEIAMNSNVSKDEFKDFIEKHQGSEQQRAAKLMNSARSSKTVRVRS